MISLSIILPVYNAKRYVRAAVESILRQTFRDFVLILIDDGSTDGSTEVCQEFARHDDRVQFISRPNKGLTSTLNEGLSLVKTRLVARMDADDLSLLTRFAKQVEYLESHSDCVCVGSRVTLIDPYDSPISATDQKLDHDEIDAELLNGIGWAIVHPAAMMRTESLRHLGGYREQFKTAQDLDLWLRLAEIGKLANLSEPLVKYRQHFESIAFTKSEDQWRCTAEIVADAYDRRGLTRPTQWPFKKRMPIPAVEQLKRWAWAALKAGNPAIARRHATALMKKRPHAMDSWRVFYCALRGR